MKIIKYINSAFTVLALSVFLASCGGGGGGNPVASTGGGGGSATITVSTNTPTQGTTFTVAISVENEMNLEQASYELSYDHNIIEVIDTVTVSNSVVNGGFFDNLFADFPGGVGNNLLLSFYNNLAAASSGSGTVCIITFRAVLQGTTNIVFINTDTKYYYADGSQSVPLLLPESITVGAP